MQFRESAADVAVARSAVKLEMLFCIPKILASPTKGFGDWEPGCLGVSVFECVGRTLNSVRRYARWMFEQEHMPRRGEAWAVMNLKRLLSVIKKNDSSAKKVREICLDVLGSAVVCRQE